MGSMFRARGPKDVWSLFWWSVSIFFAQIKAFHSIQLVHLTQMGCEPASWVLYHQADGVFLFDSCIDADPKNSDFQVATSSSKALDEFFLSKSRFQLAGSTGQIWGAQILEATMNEGLPCVLSGRSIAVCWWHWFLAWCDLGSQFGFLSWSSTQRDPTINWQQYDSI